MWELFSQALALMLVFEGMLPFATPRQWREVMRRLLRLSDTTLRTYGFLSMLTGVLILQCLHYF